MSETTDLGLQATWQWLYMGDVYPRAVDQQKREVATNARVRAFPDCQSALMQVAAPTAYGRDQLLVTGDALDCANLVSRL